MLENDKEKFRSIVIFGPPGSGKGTVSAFLSAFDEFYHLSSGDIFRGLSKESPNGKIFYQYAGKGELVPDDVTVTIWHNYVQGLIATNRFFPEKQRLLLDGVPRTEPQVKAFTPYIQVERIIVLEVKDKEQLIKRLQARAFIERRMDDMDRAVLETRMQVYDSQTAAVLKHYPKEIISRVNASQSKLEVVRDVLNELIQK